MNITCLGLSYNEYRVIAEIYSGLSAKYSKDAHSNILFIETIYKEIEKAGIKGITISSIPDGHGFRMCFQRPTGQNNEN